jgi:hypothetical protein
MKSYQEALNHYNSIKKPPRSKKWAVGAMPDNGKPLRRTGETHMGIHMRDDGAIYYRLYDTHVATFYPPQQYGEERKTFKYVPTQTTMAFMYGYGLHAWEVSMDDGTKARIPYVQHGGWRENDKVTADLVCNKYGQVIRSLSSHKDVYTMVSNDEDKAKRKELRAKVEHLITLALFKLPNLKEDVTVEAAWGEPFGTAYNNPRTVEQLKQHIRLADVNIDDPQFIEKFMEALQDLFNLYASKLCYDAETFGYFRYWELPEGADRVSAERQFKIDQQNKQFAVVADITPDGFKKSLTNMLLSASNLKTGSVRKPWGQFMPTLPVRWVE